MTETQHIAEQILYRHIWAAQRRGRWAAASRTAFWVTLIALMIGICLI